jgi:serine/threonine protein kinase/class 3 adenylate cyclase/tetratricopeptide (TPR) repeat protein
LQCRSCGEQNPDNARFCVQCGTRLASTCAGCQAELTPNAKFCANCGTPVGPAAQARRETTPVPSPAHPSSFADGRYTVERFLGEGGRKRVYLAHDMKLDRDVAFAVIKTEGLDADGLTRVQREAQAMGRLGDHANIVTVFDTGEEAAEPFIVSQYMAGGDLAAVLAQAEGNRLAISEVVSIGDQVCSGLEHAHTRGIVHRDLKPGNIWFDESGVAKIGDFGLAVALDRSRLTMQGMMVGTASYMAPEQAMGGETTSSSDLYALGCVLYEAVTGRPPFVGDDTVTVISQHLNTTPVAPTWHNPECPPALETLVLRLLEKDPKQRPSSASEVRQALDSVTLASTSAPQPAAEAPQAAESNPIYRRTFVGRESEKKQLESAFDAALSGSGALLMVVGEPGIGKTTLTEQLSTYVGLRGGINLVGHCYEEGSLSLPYLAFVEAMRTYTLAHDGAELAQQLGSGAAEVARIVSEVRDKIEVELPPPGNPEEERFRLFQAVTSFLRSAASVQPLCLILEDLHDADKGTMEMLVHLSRNLGGARLMVVGTYRDVEVDRTHPLSDALAELRRGGSFQRVPLRGLSPDEVNRMLSNITGQDVQYQLAEAIYRQTEGNPLFIQEMIRNAAEEGLITREGGQWVATVDLLTGYIPEGLRDVIGRRLSRLSQACNKILAVAAVIGRDFPVDVLRIVAGASEEELLAALEEATRVSLIEEMRGQREVRYRFTHAFFRQTLYEEMIAPRRLRMHNDVAKALEKHYAGRVEEHAAELAEHFSHSSSTEDLEKAVAYGQAAAERAAGVYAHGETVRLLDQALQVQDVLDPNDESRRYDLLSALGNSLLSAGKPERVSDEVAPAMYEIAEQSGAKERISEACWLAIGGLAYAGAGPVFSTPAWEFWVERAEKHAAPDTSAWVLAAIGRSWIHYAHKEQEACWRLRLQALETARRVADPEALNTAIVAFTNSGAPPELNVERAKVAAEFGMMPSASLRPGIVAQRLAECATILLETGDRRSFDRFSDELDAHARRVGDPYALAWQMGSDATRRIYEGDLDGSLAVCERLSDQASVLGIEVFGQLLATWYSSNTLAFLGRVDEVIEQGEAFESLLFGDAKMAYFLALAGRREDAGDELRRIMAERGIGPEEDWTDQATLVALLAAAVSIEDMEPAEMLADRLSIVPDLYDSITSTSIARQLGGAALLRGDHDLALRHFRTALEVGERIEGRPEIALARLALAETLFAHFPGEQDEASEHLDFAVRELQEMKMAPTLEQAMRLKMKVQGIDAIDPNTSIDKVAASVQDEHPDLKEHAAPDGTVTLLFSDIEGSTARTEQLGDRRWMEVLREHNAIVREQLSAHEGFEVKSEGDGFMLAFQSARKALHCAIAIQRALAGHADSSDEPIQVRIGLHTGEVIREGADFYGKHVNLAARIAGQAAGGEILVSSLLKELTASGGDIDFSGPREVQLRGLSGDHHVYAVAWQQS